MSDKIKSLMNVLGWIDELCKQPGGEINMRSAPRPHHQKSLLPGTAKTNLAHCSERHNTGSLNDMCNISYKLDAWIRIMTSLAQWVSSLSWMHEQSKIFFCSFLINIDRLHKY